MQPVARELKLYRSGGDATGEKVGSAGARPTLKDGSGDADFATGNSKSTWRWQTPGSVEMFPIRGLLPLPPEQKKREGRSPLAFVLLLNPQLSSEMGATH